MLPAFAPMATDLYLPGFQEHAFHQSSQGFDLRPALPTPRGTPSSTVASAMTVSETLWGNLMTGDMSDEHLRKLYREIKALV